jgi:hypothetical protein
MMRWRRKQLLEREVESFERMLTALFSDQAPETSIQSLDHGSLKVLGLRTVTPVSCARVL